MDFNKKYIDKPFNAGASCRLALFFFGLPS